MSGETSIKIYDIPKLEKPVLIVGWIEDASKLGLRTVDYIIQNLGCREFGEILPEHFFHMAGVNVEADVAQFPASKLFVSVERNLVIFKSNIPITGWHRFLNSLLDIAQEDCGVTEIYTLGAMISSAAHTVPRLILTVVSSLRMKEVLEPFSVTSNTDYETPPGQKPTLSSYLLWLARQRGIPAANLWVPVPYYLVPLDDPRACKRLLYFFNSKFDLGMDFTRLDGEIAEQNRKIEQLFKNVPEIEGLVRRLETGEGLDAEQSEKLAREMEDYLKQK